MSAHELLASLQAQGVAVAASNGELIVDAPAGVLLPSQRVALKQQKQALIELLTVAVMPATENTSGDGWQDPPKVIKQGAWSMVELLLDGAAAAMPVVAGQYERNADGRLVARYTPAQLEWALFLGAESKPRSTMSDNGLSQ